MDVLPIHAKIGKVPRSEMTEDRVNTVLLFAVLLSLAMCGEAHAASLPLPDKLFEWLVGLGGAATVGGGALTFNALKRRNAQTRRVFDLDAQDADVTVFAPPSAPPKSEVLIQVVIHTPERLSEAHSRATAIAPTAKELASTQLTLRLSKDDNVRVTLNCEAVANVVAEPVQDDSWNGRMVCFYFNATLPDISSASLRFNVRVFVNTIPAGHVIFKIVVRPGGQDLPLTFVEQKGQSVRDVFLSYASEDRVQVLRIAQAINALKIRYFQDVLSMSPGERWERKIYLEIDKCDTFLLFWSSHAQHSKWVIREAEYALKRAQAKQLEIVPYLLEGPPPPSPPKPLKDLHFNDPIRYAIFAEESIRKSSVPSGTLTPLPPQRLTPLSNVSEEVAAVKAARIRESAVKLKFCIVVTVLGLITLVGSLFPLGMSSSKPPEHVPLPKSSPAFPSGPLKLEPFDDTRTGK